MAKSIVIYLPSMLLFLERSHDEMMIASHDLNIE